MIELVASFPGTEADEVRLYHRFAKHRRNGERFVLSRGIRQWLVEDGWV
jgi:hypothetical protein